VPDDYIKNFGADTFRGYLMFLGPYDQGGDFQDTGIMGMHRYLKRIWRLVEKALKDWEDSPPDQAADEARQRLLHGTIEDVTDDYERLRYNTAIAKIREYSNELETYEVVSRQEVEVLLKLLAPITPFLSEELWRRIGNENSIHTGGWPRFDTELATSETVTIVVQINGKTRDTFEAERGAEKDTLVQQARERSQVKKYLDKAGAERIVFVPDKLINFVTYY